MLPALLPKELAFLRQERDLFQKLTEEPIQLFLPFFLAACDDLTWCERNSSFMQALITWITQQQLRGSGISNTFFLSAAKALRARYLELKELIAHNITVIVENSSFVTNSWLLASSSSFFAALIYRQCRIAKKSSLTLEESDLTAALFELILEYVHTASVLLLWRQEPESILALHALADNWELIELREQCVETYKRYITEENVLEILLLAQERGWELLRQKCIDFVNQAPMDIFFLPSPMGQLFFGFNDCHDKTRAYFTQCAEKITHLICHSSLAFHPFMRQALLTAPQLCGLDIAKTADYPDLLDFAPPNLRYLNISECAWLDNEQLRGLTVLFPDIEELVIQRSAGITAVGWGFIAKWKKLRRLDVTDSFHLKDDELYLLLQGAPHLEKLILANCQGLTDLGLRELARKGLELTHLDLTRTAIRNESLIEIGFRCRSLRSLDISRCDKLSEKGIKELAKNASSLKTLVAKRAPLPLATLAELQRSYPQLQVLF